MEEAEDIEMPSPKRTRTASVERASSPMASEPIDDFDDIYNTPPLVSEDAHESSQAAPVEFLKSTLHTPQTNTLLPGLGSSISHSSPNTFSHQNVGKEEPHQPMVVGSGRKAISNQTEENIVNHTEINVTSVVDDSKPGLNGPDQSRADLRAEGAGKTGDEEVLKSEGDSEGQTGDLASTGNEKSRQQLDTNTMEDASKMEDLQDRDGNFDETSTDLPHETDSTSTFRNEERSEPRSVAENIAHDQDRSVWENDQSSLAKISGTERLDFEEADEAGGIQAEAEFEMDSSPLESSSSDSLSDSSDEESDDADGYSLLSPEEQARRLMAEDGESDEDNNGKVKIARPLRTQNERPDEDVPKPDVVVTPEMKIEELGLVDNTVENLVLVKAKISGEYQVLESGSVLCLDDRSVIGVVAETLGRVQQPYYSIRFANENAIAEAGISQNTRVFYVEAHSSTVFTQPLRGVKGSDASNIHDEEVAADELEFSDDEAEAEYKRTLKLQKQARRGGREGQLEGFSKGPRGRLGAQTNHRGLNGAEKPPQSVQEHAPDPSSASLNYDDGQDMQIETEDLYTPLARPANLHEMMNRRDAPTEDRAGRWNGDRGGRSKRGRHDRGGFRGHHQNPHQQASRGRGRNGGHPPRQMYEKNHNGEPPSQPPYTPSSAVPQINTFSSSSPSIQSQTQSNGFPAPPPPPTSTQYASTDQFSPYTYAQSQQQFQQQPSYFPPPSYSQSYQQHQSQPHSPHTPVTLSGGYSQLQSPSSAPLNHQQSQPQHSLPGFSSYPPFGSNSPPYPSTASTQVSSPTSQIPPGTHINPAFFRQQQQQQSQNWYQQQ